LVLSTGTMLVPEMDVTLQEGDEVAITIAELGTLVNPVVVRGSRMTRADGQA
jgi:fumarylacetoacetate (FAA) hydrolase family protein